MIKFVLLTSQRTGSTFLRKYLNSHPNIACHGELFISRKSDKYWYDDRFYKYCFDNPLRFLMFCIGKSRFFHHRFLEVFFEEKNPAIKAKGFKLMYNQIVKNRIDLRMFDNSNFRFIHLIRKNLIKKFISAEMVRLRQIAHSTEKQQQITFKINIQDLLKRVQKFKDEVEYYRMFLEDKDSMEVSYETFFNNPEHEIIDLLDFLSIPVFKEMHCELRKLTSDNLNKIIENWDQLVQALQGTELEKYLFN